MKYNMADAAATDELDIIENHYVAPECFGIVSVKDVKMEIVRQRDLMWTLPLHSDHRENTLKKIAQLQKKLHEMQVGFEQPNDGVTMALGHMFELRNNILTIKFCARCNGIIHGAFQSWYHCLDCRCSIHDKCLNQLTSTCTNLRVQEDPNYCWAIHPEKLLSVQNYCCAECKKRFTLDASKIRACDYSGKFYCELCHQQENMLIPARVVHNWDFTRYKVSKAVKHFLEAMEKKPLIRLVDLNPLLFNYVGELSDVKKLREDFATMKKYLLLCTTATNNKLLNLLDHLPHFLENTDMYSIKDLLHVHNGTLIPELLQIHKKWARHLKVDCKICCKHGSICDLCDFNDLLFSFDYNAATCSECSYVLHRICFAWNKECCPRCQVMENNNENWNESNGCNFA